MQSRISYEREKSEIRNPKMTFPTKLRFVLNWCWHFSLVLCVNTKAVRTILIYMYSLYININDYLIQPFVVYGVLIKGSSNTSTFYLKQASMMLILFFSIRMATCNSVKDNVLQGILNRFSRKHFLLQFCGRSTK